MVSAPRFPPFILLAVEIRDRDRLCVPDALLDPSEEPRQFAEVVRGSRSRVDVRLGNGPASTEPWCDLLAERESVPWRRRAEDVRFNGVPPNPAAQAADLDEVNTHGHLTETHLPPFPNPVLPDPVHGGHVLEQESGDWLCMRGVQVALVAYPAGDEVDCCACPAPATGGQIPVCRGGHVPQVGRLDDHGLAVELAPAVALDTIRRCVDLHPGAGQESSLFEDGRVGNRVAVVAEHGPDALERLKRVCLGRTDPIQGYQMTEALLLRDHPKDRLAVEIPHLVGCDRGRHAELIEELLFGPAEPERPDSVTAADFVSDRAPRAVED